LGAARVIAPDADPAAEFGREGVDAAVHPLAAIVLAQQEFLAKGRMGKIILVP